MNKETLTVKTVKLIPNSPGQPSGTSIEELAKQTIQGKFDNGAARKAALGDNYAAVQALINKQLAGKRITPKVNQDWDLGTLPEGVITPEVVKESPIIAQETPTVVAEDPYQISAEPYQEKQILTNGLLDNGQLSIHPSSQKEIETVYLNNDFYPVINSSDYSSLEIPDNIQETPVELNIPKETRVPKKVFTKDDMAKLLANYIILVYN